MKKDNSYTTRVVLTSIILALVYAFVILLCILTDVNFKLGEMSPLVIIGFVLAIVTGVIVMAYALVKDKKESFGFERNMKDKDIIKRLLHYAKPYTGQFILVLFIMAFTIINEIVLPLILGKIVSLLRTDGTTYGQILNYISLYIVLLLVSLSVTYIQAVILQKTGQKIISNMREEVFTHIEQLSHEQLNNIPVGKLVTRTANDTASISQMFTNLIVNLIQNFFTIVGVLIAMLLVNVQLTLTILVFVPYIILFTIVFRKFSRKAYREVRNNYTNINTFLSENLSGIKVTQIFNQEEKKNKDFNNRNDALAKAATKQIFVFGIFRPAIYFLYISSMIAIFWIASTGVLNNVEFLGQTIEAETIVIFYQYLSTFFNPIQNLAEQFNRIQSAFASAEKVFTILDMQPEIVDEPDSIELGEIKGDIEFKNVWFAYIGEEWVLKNVSFKVNAKETVAFVGSTGSGKTTILSLIVRNYDIQMGQILIDGIDIKHIKISSLRKHFGQMLQDVFIFSGTIRSNIVLRDENITDEEIKQACEYVNADSFINKLELGLDEPVRERGNNFSAGQRQLLSFARTIVHKPEVMILDEATANIDTETELLIQDSLNKMMNIGTMLIVAHRLSTIQHADNIIVISHGEIVEQGSHQELLKLRGSYYKLYQLQYHKELLNK